MLEKHRISYDLLVHTRHLKYVKTVAETCPNLRLVVDHMAKPPVASGDMADWAVRPRRWATYPNVSLQTVRLVTEATGRSWTRET